jgi:16S rRNA (guanine527-N7)-methyltransferase
LTVAPYIREPFVDVGSGAGLPAIPIALATGSSLTLIEATTKKARFLTEALEALGLNGRVVTERAETAAHSEQLRERFASGTARAVASAPTVVELLLPLLSIGGVAILQRGGLDPRERTALADASLMLGGRVEAERELEGNRRIVLVRKESATPQRFPRRPGIPEKRPLCQ